MDRRRFLLTTLAGAFATPLVAEAQPAGKLHRIGYLGNSSADLERHLVQAFRDGLRGSGYVEGQNVVIEYWADGNFDRLPVLAVELARIPGDVIVAADPRDTRCHAGDQTIPIVMAVSADAVGNRLVASLARPGGDVTGSNTRTHELDAKRLELLKEAFPGLSRVAFLWNPANPGNVLGSKETRLAARALRVTLQPDVTVRTPNDFDQAFAAIVAGAPDALFVVADRFLLAHRERIIAFAAKHRLRASYPYREYVAGGGLMSYSPSFAELFRHAATVVDEILKGVGPGDIPIEQPTKFELVINMKTAKALGLTIPPSLLLRAEQIIE